MINTNESKPAAKRPRRVAREPKPAGEVATSSSTPIAELEAKTDKPVSKSSLVLAMLERPEGATIAQIVDATSWLPHTARAALTGLKKKGHLIERRKVDGVSKYFIVKSG